MKYLLALAFVAGLVTAAWAAADMLITGPLAPGGTITGSLSAGSAPPPPVGCVPDGQMDMSNNGCGMIYMGAVIH